ncbi:MAG: aminoglycoside phosphotransferase family protein [Acetatifactor sp.]|nr:aminoglycoside phosphotransferase family protein [Acetatifactor sp.]
MEIMAKKVTEAEVVSYFLPGEKILTLKRHGNGHINDTFLLETDKDKYILQRINHEIFKEPERLMENIYAITTHLKKSIRKNGGDENRESLTVIKTSDDKLLYEDADGGFWRMYLFIEDAVCLEKVEKPEDFYESALAFGNFQRMLSDFDPGILHETIPDFHNTPKRYEDFEKAVALDKLGRAANVSKEIEFVRSHREEMGLGEKLLREGKLPLRVTHNDTKLNNIMMDKKTGKGITIIDLDTVMPGLAIYDFGDSIRFGANTAAEDETDLSKVSLDLGLFRVYAEGFIKGAAGGLTDEEIKMLPYGAKNMTMECGMRFLTDHLLGDTYFKIHRENHNLDRARDQFALVADMEAKRDEMQEIIEKIMRDQKEKIYA